MDKIKVVGARAHNLKNLTVEIPRNKLTVITGVSGSGKSSLAFDTIYAEGQRRYVESLSSYARQFLGSLEKPDIDYIEGLSPALSIDQKTAGISPRSTVGTMSEIYDYLRLLFARIGVPHCLNCGEPLVKQEIEIKKSFSDDPLDRTKTISQSIYKCFKCDYTLGELDISSFSFNSPKGACFGCHGLGERLEIDPTLIIPNTRLTLAEGAIRPWSRTTSHANWYNKALRKLALDFKFSLDTQIGHLTKNIRDIIIYGYGDPTDSKYFEGVIPNLDVKYKETDSDYVRTEIEKYMVKKTCPVCDGKRLKAEVQKVTINNKNIVEIVSMNIAQILEFFTKLDKTVNDRERKIVGQIISDIIKRIKFIIEVGLSYLTLDRSAESLAGGEAQRIRLATQLGSYLTGVIYILDEPSIGLHERDQKNLINNLYRLRDINNTVVVVEHDKQTIEAADYIIDMGPGAGEFGGNIIAQGNLEEIKKDPNSITGQYLTGKKQISVPKTRRPIAGNNLIIKGASEHNLKNIDVKIPLNTLTCITGVSGSGKSTLIWDILARALSKKFHNAKTMPGAHKALIGVQNLDKVINIDQSPIGRTPRSNPATYANVFSPIRDLFANTPEAIKRKYGSGHFSFNVKGGRCETCKGDGVIKFEMHFLPDVYVTCDTCHGRRYNKEVLDIYYNGKNIADVLDLTIDDALVFFKSTPVLNTKLSVLSSVGLGYMKLGQSATTLSGGEAQRVKLATELARQDTGKTLYILDEPTTGLHFEDINRLLKVLQALIDKGNSVIVIEHNMDVIKCADHIIDMGPDGGDNGGTIIAQGTPEEVAKIKNSFTGQFLKSYL
jgi:excinuclease ABC subunit A